MGVQVKVGCVQIQGLHPSEYAFEGCYVTAPRRRLSKFVGSFKCGPQIRPPFPRIGRMGVVDPFPSYLSHNSFRQSVMADEASGSGVGEEYAFRWTKEQTEMFIKLRGENDELFTGAKNSATVGWRIVLEKMGLSGKVTPAQAKKKWDNLKKKYKVCPYIENHIFVSNS